MVKRHVCQRFPCRHFNTESSSTDSHQSSFFADAVPSTKPCSREKAGQRLLLNNGNAVFESHYRILTLSFCLVPKNTSPFLPCILYPSLSVPYRFHGRRLIDNHFYSGLNQPLYRSSSSFSRKISRLP